MSRILRTVAIFLTFVGFAYFLAISRLYDINFDTAGSAIEAKLQHSKTGGEICKLKSEHKDLRYLCNTNQHYDLSQCPREKTNSLSTTLVTQTTFDRVQLLLQTCERWKSPIVSVVYVSSHERKDSWLTTIDEYKRLCPHLHLIPYNALSDSERTLAYPINRLRNTALDNVKTSHVLLIDADFIPSVELDVAVLKAIKLTANKIKSNNNASAHNYALVVPAFERPLKTSPCESFESCRKVAEKDPEFMPRNIPNLKKCVESKECIVFHSDYYKDGHGDTKSEKWLKSKDESLIRHIPCISDGYEPYVVVPWCPNNANHDATVGKKSENFNPISPYFDERFYGYGKNKIQQIKHLRARGYRFAVIPPLGFLTHHPHPESSTKLNWKGKKDKETKTDSMKQKMFDLFDEYKEDLQRVYSKTQITTKVCMDKRRRPIRWHIYITAMVALLLIVWNFDVLKQWYQNQIIKDDWQKR